MADQTTTPIADAAKATPDEDVAEDVAELLDYANRYGTPGNAPCSALGRRTARRIAERLLTAAGSPSPTLGPTRDDIEDVIRERLLILGHYPELTTSIATDVMELLSTPATVLWEGETTESVVRLGSNRSCLPSDLRVLSVPPGTRVAVTRGAASG